MKKKRKKVWFTRVRGSYLPCSWQGWATYIPMIIFSAAIIVSAIREANSFGQAIYIIFPSIVCVAVVMHWLASIKS